MSAALGASAAAPAQPGPPPPRLELTGITKRYPALLANSDVSLVVQPGEIHALLGENGAGKSTLVKIIYGALRPDAGSMRFDGRAVQLTRPQQARALGIAMVFQHLSLVDALTVAQNVWLALAPRVRLDQVCARIRACAADYGLDLDPLRPVHTLSVGQMQRVEILRALLGQPRLLILDEPTAVLSAQAADKLFAVLRRLAAEGCSILYISHKLHEVRALCSACTVLRGGRVVGRCDPAAQSEAQLARLMIGADPPRLAPQPARSGAAVLRLRGLSLARAQPFGVDLVDLHCELRAGEVLGIAGVSGNGQQELLRALSGEDRRARAASIELAGRAAGALGPQQRRALGLHVVPEERLGRGAVPALSLAQNLLLTRSEALGRCGWIRVGRLRAQAARIIARFGVQAGGPQALAASLSGGNLQKFIVGREIDSAPRLLIAAQPTWGVDLGAATQIRAALLALRDAGCALLVFSEDLDELFQICDRIQVLAHGRLSPALPRAQATAERIAAWMSGLWQDADGAAVPAAPAPPDAAPSAAPGAARPGGGGA